MEKIYKLKNHNGIIVYVSNIGAGIYDITLPRDNKEMSILLHPASEKDYYYSNQYFGKCCGRTAGRITTSSFDLNNKHYKIENTLPYDVLHGGTNGMSFKEFSVSSIQENEIDLFYVSPDGESGYPGTLKVLIKYIITDENRLLIVHEYESDEDTLCNLTSHMYFNLTKDNKNNILNELIEIKSNQYGYLNPDNVPLGLRNVTPSFDFNVQGAIIKKIYDTEVQKNLGFNHPYTLTHSSGYDASIEDKENNIRLEFRSTYNALQFFTCNYPDTTMLNSGSTLKKYDAVCLEFQHFPNGINSDFIQDKKDICKKGIKHKETTEIKFIY